MRNIIVRLLPVGVVFYSLKPLREMKHITLILTISLVLGEGLSLDVFSQSNLQLPFSGSLSESSIGFSVTNHGGGDSVYGRTTSGGHGIYGRSDGSSGSAVFAESYGGGVSLNAFQRGTGHSAYFRITNTNSSAYTLISKNLGLGPGGYFEINNTANGNPVLWAWTNGSGWTGRFETANGKGVYISAPSEALGLHVENGSVQIGDVAVPAEFKMAVDGKVIVEELQVQLTSAWPDYVFDEDYTLTPLSEVESHILEKNHLPGLPSAEEVEEAGGVAVGEMQLKLLEKIEELTLYLIAQQKANLELQERVLELEALLQDH